MNKWTALVIAGLVGVILAQFALDRERVETIKWLAKDNQQLWEFSQHCGKLAERSNKVLDLQICIRDGGCEDGEAL